MSTGTDGVRPQVGLLGEVGVLVAGRWIGAGPPRQRCVLAVLAHAPGRVVHLDAVIDRVWGESPPPGARQTVYAYVARLRRLLRPASVGLTRRCGGYVLDLAPHDVDAHRFRALATDPAGLGPALDLWRGDPLTGVAGDWAAAVRAGLERERLTALARFHEEELRRGRFEAVVGPLSELVSAYPTAEPLVGHLMTALCGAGRRAEALRAYAEARSRIRRDLGVEPALELRELHARVLRG
ncbi:hypothetical protein Lfu02_13150 [Longispora fulva]|nr:hypothetical protein Lfu02_13150 [Longispora fulva]